MGLWGSPEVGTQEGMEVSLLKLSLQSSMLHSVPPLYPEALFTSPSSLQASFKCPLPCQAAPASQAEQPLLPLRCGDRFQTWAWAFGRRSSRSVPNRRCLNKWVGKGQESLFPDFWDGDPWIQDSPIAGARAGVPWVSCCVLSQSSGMADMTS